MAKTLLKVANSLTKNVSSNKIITDTKKSEMRGRTGKIIGCKKNGKGSRNPLSDHKFTIFIRNWYIRRCGIPVYRSAGGFKTALLAGAADRSNQFGDSPYQSYSALPGIHI